MSVERKASFTAAPGHHYLLELEQRPHTRVDDESAIEKKFSFGEVLGQGSFGVVREVTNRLTGEQFAVKIVNKDKPGSSTIQLLEREVEVLKRVNHPHIIKLEEVFETPKKMYLVMELCKGGELSKILRERGHFNEEDTKNIMRKMTEVVVYMHDKDMVHRDLKLENVLVSTAEPDIEHDIKVTDFGLAHMKSLPCCDDEMYSRCGTLYYMAPEVLNNRHEYTKLCDVWSLGIIMYALLCGRVPFQSDHAAKLEEMITQGELKFTEIEWINVSDRAKKLIQSMLCVDTTQRFTARRVLDDPWFTGQSNRGVLNALALMRDIAHEENGTETTLPATSPRSSLETLLENGGKSQEQKPEITRRTPTKSLTGRRVKSTSAVLPPPAASSNLKFPSTSAISGKPRQRAGSIPAPSSKQTPRRPSTSYSTRTTGDRKCSSPSRN